MFCMKCGAECKDGAKFCIKCGAPIWTSEEYSDISNSNNINKNQGATSSDASRSNTFQYILLPPKSFNAGTIIVWIGCLLGFISLALSFYNVSLLGSTQSITLMNLNNHAALVILLIIIVVVSFFAIYVGDIVGVGIVFILLIIDIIGVTQSINMTDSTANLVGDIWSMFGVDLAYESGGFGPGLFLLICGILLILIGAICGLVLKRRRQGA